MNIPYNQIELKRKTFFDAFEMFELNVSCKPSKVFAHNSRQHYFQLENRQNRQKKNKHLKVFITKISFCEYKKCIDEFQIIRRDFNRQVLRQHT